MYISLRECIAEDLLENGARTEIGGPGHIAEIDESRFGERKYNRGRRTLGGYCRFAEHLDNAFWKNVLETKGTTTLSLAHIHKM